MTGESNAVIKNTKNNLLIGGTQIISVKDAIVEVTNTGFRSAKGRLLRTLVYKYGFEKTFMTQVVQFLSVILFITFCATIHLMIKFYSDWMFLTLM
jgi:magnesium-transporting ATPase (P-type)